MPCGLIFCDVMVALIFGVVMVITGEIVMRAALLAGPVRVPATVLPDPLLVPIPMAGIMTLITAAQPPTQAPERHQGHEQPKQAGSQKVAMGRHVRRESRSGKAGYVARADR